MAYPLGLNYDDCHSCNFALVTLASLLVLKNITGTPASGLFCLPELLFSRLFTSLNSLSPQSLGSNIIRLGMLAYNCKSIIGNFEDDFQ